VLGASDCGLCGGGGAGGRARGTGRRTNQSAWTPQAMARRVRVVENFMFDDVEGALGRLAGLS